MEITKIILFIGCSLYLLAGMTWIFYLAFMNLKRNKDKIHPTVKKLFFPFYILALLLDVLFNIIGGTLWYLERPKEWLFTTRCERHKAQSSGWRLRNANIACGYLLNPFDPSGEHC